MPSSSLTCPWCPAHPKSEQYFGHLYSRHFDKLWSGNNKTTLNVRIKKMSTAPIMLSLPEPAPDLFVCLGCLTAVKSCKVAFAHEDTCKEACLKQLELMKDKVSTEERTYTKQEMMEVLAKVNSYIKILEDEISELKDEKKEEGEEGSDEDELPPPPIDFRMKFPKFFRNLGLF